MKQADYVRHKLSEGNKLLTYVGKLKDDEAKAMLKDIRTDRKNKRTSTSYHDYQPC